MSEPHTQPYTDLAALSAYSRSRDPRLFELLIERYQSMVLASCRRRLGDDCLAEDAMQDAFLQLSVNAGRIHSNAAAWLHRCAMRRCDDIMRRDAARRARESHAAARPVGASAAQITWCEIEPIVDEALAELSEMHRELIVTRFLLGRSQADMAREAGVAEGTMHRRIDRAITRLRSGLTSRGVAVSTTAVLSGAMLHAASDCLPSVGCAASLAKVGLTGLGATGSASRVAGVLAWSSAGLIGAAAIVVGVLWAGSPGAAAPAMTASVPTLSFLQPAAGTAPARPSRTIKGLTLVDETSSDSTPGWMVCDAETLTFSLEFWDSSSGSVTMRITDADHQAKKPWMRVVVEDAEAPEWIVWSQLKGNTLDVRYGIDGFGRLRMETEIPTDGGTDEMVWIGKRPSGAAQETDGPPIAGRWDELSDWGLTLSKDDITVTSGEYKIYRFRVLEWGASADHARVQTICADSMNPGMVGERTKLLLRDDGDGYTLVFHQDGVADPNEWPGGLDGLKGSGRIVMIFKKEQP